MATKLEGGRCKALVARPLVEELFFVASLRLVYFLLSDLPSFQSIFFREANCYILEVGGFYPNPPQQW